MFHEEECMAKTEERPMVKNESRKSAEDKGRGGMKVIIAVALGAGMIGYVLKDKLGRVLRSVHLSYDDAPPQERGHKAGSAEQRKEVRVNEDQVMGKWHQIKGKVKEKWGDLTDDEITQGEGKLEELAGKIQQKYGGVKEQILAHLRTIYPDPAPNGKEVSARKK